MFNLHWGIGTPHFKLEKLRVRHLQEEFDNGYMTISYRYDVSFPRKKEP